MLVMSVERAATLIGVVVVAPRAAPALPSAFGAIVVGTIIELQWTISLVESRTFMRQKIPARLPGILSGEERGGEY